MIKRQCERKMTLRVRPKSALPSIFRLGWSTSWIKILVSQLQCGWDPDSWQGTSRLRVGLLGYWSCSWLTRPLVLFSSSFLPPIFLRTCTRNQLVLNICRLWITEGSKVPDSCKVLTQSGYHRTRIALTFLFLTFQINDWWGLQLGGVCCWNLSVSELGGYAPACVFAIDGGHSPTFRVRVLQ